MKSSLPLRIAEISDAGDRQSVWKKRLTILIQAVINVAYAAGNGKDLDERLLCEVGRRQGAHPDPFSPLRDRRIRGNPMLQGRFRSRGVPAPGARRPALRFRAYPTDGDAFHPRGRDR